MVNSWAAAVVITLALVVVLSFARKYTSLVLVYVFLDLAAQFAKRLVFVFPGQSSASQYLVLLVPKLLICGLGYVALERRRLDLTDKLWIAFIGLLVMSTVLHSSDQPVAMIVGMGATLPPFLEFFVFRHAAEKEEGFVADFCRLMVVLALANGVYGLSQSVFGPGPVEQAWAVENYLTSIEARNVNRFMEGPTVVLRAFGFSADHFSYAYMLVAGLVALMFLRSAGLWATPWYPAHIALILGGLVASWARTAWGVVGFTLLIRAALPYAGRLGRRIFFGGLVGAYVLACFFSGFLYARYSGRQTLGTQLSRQAFNVSTLSARVNFRTALIEGAKRFPVFGQGVAAGYWVQAKFTGSLGRPDGYFDAAHNFLIGLIGKAGLPGLAVFLLWFFVVIGRGLEKIASSEPDAGRYRWIMAVVIACFLLGSVGSATFFDAGFLRWAGFLTAATAAGARPVTDGHAEGVRA